MDDIISMICDGDLKARFWAVRALAHQVTLEDLTEKDRP